MAIKLVAIRQKEVKRFEMRVRMKEEDDEVIEVTSARRAAHLFRIFLTRGPTLSGTPRQKHGPSRQRFVDRALAALPSQNPRDCNLP